MMPADQAVARFNEGRSTSCLGGRIQNFPLTRSVGILRGTIQIDPVAGLFGLEVMDSNGFLSLPENREALAMAIDRDKLLANFGLGGWKATTRVVAPGLDGDLGTIGERWSQQSIEERRALAGQRVRQWAAQHKAAPKAGASGAGQAGRGPAAPALGKVPSGNASGAVKNPASAPGALAVLRIWLPAGAGSDLLFTALQSDLQAIGLSLTRADNARSADLALVDAVARYPQATWFLNQLSCATSQGLCSPEADARLAEAAKAQRSG